MSITDGENWTRGDSSTPILLNFKIIETEASNNETTDNFENENQENVNLQQVLETNHLDQSIQDDNESLDKIDDKIKYKKGFMRSSSNKSYFETPDSKQKIFESSDSLAQDNLKSYSFDTKSSSLDRGSSVDIVVRDLSFDQKEESADQFDAYKCTRRKNYSVYVETDISKCGVMEEDTVPDSLNLRRNTCPNPFQYR